MSLTIYHNPKCGTSRKVLAALQDAGHAPTIIEYLKTPPSRATLKGLFQRMGRKPSGLNALLGAPFISYLVKMRPDYDLMSFDPNKDVAESENSFAGREISATDPDLRKFFGHGGKLILWHGFNDPGPSPMQTIKYLDEVSVKTGGEIENRARLFLAPGVYHCRGGPGPDKFDALSALDAWIEKGTAPTRIIATKANSPMSRPLCAYPELARYNGSGDTNDAASFTCMTAN